MIIDLILDRKEGKPYSARDFYSDVCQYGSVGSNLACALDSGTEEDVKNELHAYLLANDYNPDLRGYVDSVHWLRS